METARKQLEKEQSNNDDYRETIQKLHSKYKNIIENIAHDAGKYKTDAFINKSL